ncbi:MAG: hypothetical protein AUK44_02605 [Porphyromonadaceae bacterium CG2_30_38_12]|nr:MAG: hypothetical protein AUK44_02605 [Porphyromonadaceae bacterium CG2_30_38_12]
MIQAFLVSAILLIIGVLILGFRIFFIKNGEFPNIHIGGQQALKDKGVHCATTQDRDARKTKVTDNNQVYTEITKL